MAKKNWLVIVNPNAGAGRCRKDWHLIENILKSSGLDYCEVFTERRFHAIILTRNLIREGFRRIIVVGGDGTLNEVINGIFAQSDCPTEEIGRASCRERV